MSSDLTKAAATASSESDAAHPAKTDAQRQNNSDPTKMEDDLIRNKENKVHTTSADQVAGRKDQGTVLPEKLSSTVSKGLDKLKPGSS